MSNFWGAVQIFVLISDDLLPLAHTIPANQISGKVDRNIYSGRL